MRIRTKWVVISLVFVLIAAIAFAARLWLPDLIDSEGTNRDSIQTITSVVTAGAALAALAVPLLAVLLTYWLNRPSVPEPETPAALRQLPAPRTDFVGRKDEIKKLRRSIKKGKVAGVVIQGMGGVGKSELALVLAQDQSKRYRDAHIFLDLKGFSDETALTAAQAMAHVVRSFHPRANLPEDESALGGRYRSVLDGKKALLVMDNVVDKGHLEPLIPPSGSLILATSRKRFELDGLFALDLDAMEPGDARKLLLAIAPRIGDEADEIARLCEYLPLALRYVGNALAERPDLSPSSYVERLAGVKDRLKLVEESLGLSYDILDPEVQAKWRTLAVFPDAFDVTAARAVWDVDAGTARDALSDLRAYSLVEWSDTANRYRLHDLARVFADSRLAKNEIKAARRQHAGHYLVVLGLANELYLKGGEDVMQGLSLFDLEWGNIEAGQAWAAARAEGDDRAAELTNRYPGAGVHVMALRLHPRERIGWFEAAVASAQRMNDPFAEGRHLGNLGLAYAALGEMRRAIKHHEQALVISREIGDRRGEGNALGNLGITHKNLGETRRAIEHHELALVISREIGDRRGESSHLGNLGLAHANLGKTRRAIEHHEQALVINRETGDRRGEGNALGNLGSAYAALGETRRATEHYEQQLVIAREIGDRRGEGNALWNTALALDELGERAQATANAEVALEVREQIEDPNAGKVRDKLAEWRGQE